MAKQTANAAQSKDRDLAAATVAPEQALTDNLGHRISDDQNSLRIGQRGPTLMEDFHLREKIHHFDHERIPERVVHARGAGAHGYFQLYESLADYTIARVLTDTALQTPVFVRFSTVAGSRGSADTARDVRGFAVRFYTAEGNWDIVGNNMPVFFIQDAIKFPDVIHAVKPEPNNEIPQASSAHDTFWDFISLTPESMHMIMWVMSDRAIPRSFSMMEGFGVNTFRLVNAQGKSHFVKFHWKPVLGIHSLVWDEAQKLAGKDPDFHRRDMHDAIEQGNFFEWELGVQIIADGEEAKFDFDILDATKLWPEDLVPVRRIGKMTLNRNPDNFFAETEQVAFMTTNIVPGIDFSDDPLLQGRNFSYLDTQLSRLGSPNWPELPINRPLAVVSNNQRDGHMRQTINPGRVSYEPNSLGGNIPNQVSAQQGGYVSYPERVEGPKLRVRSESFADHYGQAKLFWNSMTPTEKEHIVKALQFELSKVDTREIRQRMLGHLLQINETLAAQVAIALGELPAADPTASPDNPATASNGKGARAAKSKTARGADGKTGMPDGTAAAASEIAALASATSLTSASGGLQQTSGLSMEEHPTNTIKGRKVAILAADGAAADQVATLKKALKAAGALGEVVGPHLGVLQGTGGEVEAVKTFANSGSIMFDAVFVPGGEQSIATLIELGDAREFINEAYKHGKAIAAVGEGINLVAVTEVGQMLQLDKADHQTLAALGLVLAANAEVQGIADQFIAAIAQHRNWNRSNVSLIAA
jgi:catalase